MNNFIGTKGISSKQEIYEVTFKVLRGRLFLKDIKQIEGGNKDEK